MLKSVLLAFALVFTANCTAPVSKKPAKPVQVQDNEHVTDMLIWICFQHSDGTDAALEACGAEY